MQESSGQRSAPHRISTTCSIRLQLANTKQSSVFMLFCTFSNIFHVSKQIKTNSLIFTHFENIKSKNKIQKGSKHHLKYVFVDRRINFTGLFSFRSLSIHMLTLSLQTFLPDRRLWPLRGGGPLKCGSLRSHCRSKAHVAVVTRPKRKSYERE